MDRLYLFKVSLRDIGVKPPEGDGRRHARRFSHGLVCLKDCYQTIYMNFGSQLGLTTCCQRDSSEREYMKTSVPPFSVNYKSSINRMPRATCRV